MILTREQTEVVPDALAAIHQLARAVLRLVQSFGVSEPKARAD